MISGRTLDFSNEVFDIIFQGGQSNAEGCGVGPTSDPYVPTDDICYLSRWDHLYTAEEHMLGETLCSDFGLFFAREYVRQGLLEKGRKVLIVRGSRGGTGWVDHQWGVGEPLFEESMDYFRKSIKLNPANRVVAFLWHQGETDSDGVTTMETHYQHLTTLVNLVRAECGNPRLPFICADFCHDWKSENAAHCEPIISAMINSCIDLGHARFVLTDTLKSNRQGNDGVGDNIHFCRDSLRLLGQRYFDAYRDLSGR